MNSVHPFDEVTEAGTSDHGTPADVNPAGALHVKKANAPIGAALDGLRLSSDTPIAGPFGAMATVTVIAKSCWVTLDIVTKSHLPVSCEDALISRPVERTGKIDSQRLLGDRHHPYVQI
jgi:hypothetical protein